MLCILHFNLNAFPVSVARVVDSSLREWPVAVAAGVSSRTVTLAVSREAYLDGVVKGMPVGRATKLCPSLKIIPPNPDLNRRASRALYKLVSNYSPLVEPARMGHMYVDLTGTRRLFSAPAPDLAARIQREIRERLRLPATVGIAGNKLVSYVASRVIRPRGLFDIFPGGERTFLSPLSVEELPGIGIKTAEKLRDLNVLQVGELASFEMAHLNMAFAAPVADRLYRFSRGIDNSPVRPPEKKPTIREEETLAEDSNDDSVLMGALFLLVERAGRRLRESKVMPKTLVMEIRYADYMEVKRQVKIKEPSNMDKKLFDEAAHLFEKIRKRRTRVRYMSVAFTDLVPYSQQLNLFDGSNSDVRAYRGSAELAEVNTPLQAALDALRAEYGHDVVRYGRTLV